MFKHILLIKEQNAKFPTDEEFTESLVTRDIYSLNSRNKQYLFSRLENGDSKEQINVIERIKSGDYSIEHIMPQTLTKEWEKNLGDDSLNIHKRWLHTLPNLTLTGYNAKYSNLPFFEKLTIKNGFKDSNLRLNKFIGKCENWTEKELILRQKQLELDAVELWIYPVTKYVSPKKDISSYSLDDDFNFTGISLYSYEFLGNEKIFSTWIDLLADVTRSLISLYPAQMQQLASNKENTYISTDKLSNSFSELDGYFIYGNCNTSVKISVLRNFFKQCDIPFEELTFNVLAKKQNINL